MESKSNIGVYRFKYFRFHPRIYIAASNIRSHITTVPLQYTERYSKTPGPLAEKFLNVSLSQCYEDRCTFTYTERIKHLSCKIIIYMHIYKYVFYVRLYVLCPSTLPSMKNSNTQPYFNRFIAFIQQNPLIKMYPDLSPIIYLTF